MEPVREIRPDYHFFLPDRMMPERVDGTTGFAESPPLPEIES